MVRKTTDTKLDASPSRRYGPRMEIFKELMSFRVRDILVVSSLYDSYILQEDGRLRDTLASEYQSLNLPDAPNVKHVTTGEAALQQLQKRGFDLVVTMMRLGDMDAFDFARLVKEKYKDLPVVLLAYNTRELERIMERHTGEEIDRVFVWHGDGTILLAIVKYLEDKANAENDIVIGGVPAIILIEDSVDFYSSYLPIIYKELVYQIQHVLRTETILSRRYIRTRARPKVLLATSYEEGWTLFEKYRDNLMGVISDCRFPREGKVIDTAGLEFARAVRAEYSDMPILLQSSDPKYARLAEKISVAFLRKGSRSLLRDLSRFIKNNFGFGDFIFRMPDGTVVGCAADLFQMEQALRDLPPESIKWHGEHHHFSRWLMARTEFELARELKQYDVSSFDSIEKVRAFLIKSLQKLCLEAHAGVVTVYSQQQCKEHTRFVRIGSGSLGGKGRGLAFIHELLDRYDLRTWVQNVKVRVPRTAVIASDVFDQFLDENNLRQFALEDVSDQEIIDAFVHKDQKFELPRELENFFDGPVAVRSSSMLEDAFSQPFAGTYDTLMLPHNDPDPKERRRQLIQAIRYVYASTYFRSAKAYIDTTPNRVEEEKMAIVLQELVGTQHEHYFYPNIGGIARSYNYYPVGPQEPDHGIAHVVLGLGNTVVEGGISLRFSPYHPQILPQFSNIRTTLANSQRSFSALDLSRPFFPEPTNSNPNLVELELDVAERHGTLWPVGSTYSAENDRIYDGVRKSGVKFVSFAHVLKSDIFPLASILEVLLTLGSSGMGAPVEIEYAVNLEMPGDEPKEFDFLQIRPLVVGHTMDEVTLNGIENSDVICFCSQALGNGSTRNIHDLLYVDPANFDAAATRQIALEVADFNQRLRDEDRSFILIGPGRWGSSDNWLGIPVLWNQISQAKAIVEVNLEGYVVEPSQGSHFFQNMTSFEVGYFSLDSASKEDRVDWDWLTSQPTIAETEHLRLVRTDSEMEVRIDGRTGRGAIIKPGANGYG